MGFILLNISFRGSFHTIHIFNPASQFSNLRRSWMSSDILYHPNDYSSMPITTGKKISRQRPYSLRLFCHQPNLSMHGKRPGRQVAWKWFVGGFKVRITCFWAPGFKAGTPYVLERIQNLQPKIHSYTHTINGLKNFWMKRHIQFAHNPCSAWIYILVWELVSSKEI